MEEKTAWHEWRRKGIGASDAPVIMGVSPYTTLRELYRDKAGLPPLKTKSSYIMDRGNMLEPIARARYELMYGMSMRPESFEHYHEDFRIFRCSMDGSNRALSRGLEIKYVGEKDWHAIKAGEVPERYYPQLQHQLFVTGFQHVDFFAYYLPKEFAKDADFFHRGESHRIVVEPNLPYITRYLQRAFDFWQMVQDGREPEDPPKKPRKSKARPDTDAALK